MPWERQPRIPGSFCALSDPNPTLNSHAFSSQMVAEPLPARCCIYAASGPLWEVFLPLQQKRLLELPALVSHFPAALDGASLPSLVTRPPPCSGSCACFITSLFTVFAGNLGRLTSSKADINRQQKHPSKSTQLCGNFALSLTALQNWQSLASGN